MQRRHFVACAAGSLIPLVGCGPQTPAAVGHFTAPDPERAHLLREPRRRWGEPAISRRVGVLVLGGGVAGLAATRALRMGAVDDFALLELEDEAGGNSRGSELQGLPCPLGAHYLPLPPDDAREVQALLEELGLRRREAGRWVYDERHLCHSPQERLYIDGAWQEGLLPQHGLGDATREQYRRFSDRVASLQKQARFVIPTANAPLAPVQLELDALTFQAWLQREGLTDAHLLWYLDYCCRDDYGAGLAQVSAWAGLHYFASRHGFQAPGDDSPHGEGGLLTWPEGNGWLTRRLAAPLGGRGGPLFTGRVVLRVEDQRHGVAVDVWDVAARRTERWLAAHCIVALPVHVAARVVQSPPDWLIDTLARWQTAPWLVANLHLSAPLRDRFGAPPAWDNVVYGGAGLGYVDAGHQRLDPRPGPTVLTCYRALGDQAKAGREALLQKPWTHWRDQLLSELAAPHPELRERLTHLSLTRYGHAMAIPRPGVLAHLSRMPASDGVYLLSKQKQSTTQRVPAVLGQGRLSFAHSDWSGYSVFEEAFTRGHDAGLLAVARLRGRLGGAA